MKIEITNASYSTALTYELVTQYDFQVLGAPVFPSFRDEAFYKADTKNPILPLFIQYKLGEYFIGSTSALKNFWGVPYYRFQIHPKNKMKAHRLLLNLESMKQLVYYIAPEFHNINEFYKHLMKQKLLNNSTFWSPRVIGELSEDRRYSISYKRNIDFGLLEPGQEKVNAPVKGEGLLDIIRHKFEADQFEVYDDEKLFNLGDKMLDNYLEVFHGSTDQELIEDIRLTRERIDPRDFLSMIAILLYDCYIYTIGAS